MLFKASAADMVEDLKLSAYIESLHTVISQDIHLENAANSFTSHWMQVQTLNKWHSAGESSFPGFRFSFFLLIMLPWGYVKVSSKFGTLSNESSCAKQQCLN
jgi:hypothetical protein